MQNKSGRFEVWNIRARSCGCVHVHARTHPRGGRARVRAYARMYAHVWLSSAREELRVKRDHVELRELVRLNSVAAQLIKHCRSPPLCEGPRGPMVSYFGTLTGFHSAPSQPIVSGRRGHALDVVEREHGAGNVSYQVLRSGLSSEPI